MSRFLEETGAWAGTVNRLIDYKWSCYPVYAYGRKGPRWLSTKLILSYFTGSGKNRQYREKVQKYVKEEKLLKDKKLKKQFDLFNSKCKL